MDALGNESRNYLFWDLIDSLSRWGGHGDDQAAKFMKGMAGVTIFIIMGVIGTAWASSKAFQVLAWARKLGATDIGDTSLKEVPAAIEQGDPSGERGEGANTPKYHDLKSQKSTYESRSRHQSLRGYIAHGLAAMIDGRQPASRPLLSEDVQIAGQLFGSRRR